MENKYYTPTIEEFHVGFEYEASLLSNNNIPFQWELIVFKTKQQLLQEGIIIKNQILTLDEIKSRINEKSIQVKHLDREDIESLGWEFIKQHSGTTDFDFEKGDYSLNFDPEFGYKWNLRIYDAEDQDNEFNYFNGFLKNKSELKKLMQQLDIK
jgi:hypothetical protein